MAEEEWFRGNDWDKETQEFFESKLKKSRGSYNKSQYTMIKAGYLLDSHDKYKESEGCKLLERLIKEYPNEISNVMYAFEQLGDYFFKKDELIKAEFNYRQSISYYKSHGRSGTSGIGDIKLAEVVLNSNQANKFEEAYRLLTDEFKKTHGELTFNDEKYRYMKALALLSIKLNKVKEAKEYAKMALELSNIKEPQLDKYPKVGIIRTKEEEIESLKHIVNL
jgi:hypothetical protein